MYFLYQISIRFYYFLIWVASGFNSRAKDFIKAGRQEGRKAEVGDKEKEKGEERVVWFHASSLGEYEQGLPVIEEWRARCPDDFILLTFYSPSGYKNYNDNPAIDQVEYLPKDLRSHIIPFLDHFQPGKAVFIKYDIWPVLMMELSKRNIPAYLITSVFRDKQAFFKWYGKWYLGILKLFSWISVQDKDSEDLLKNHGIENVNVTGDTRIDRVIKRADSVYPIEGIREFCGESRIIVAGSSWQEEEAFLYRFFREGLAGGYKLILCPHDVSGKHLNSIRIKFGSDLISYTDFILNSSNAKGKTVLLIDRIGLLASLYSYADIAIIGGAFGRGLHSILEPAAFGLPIIFGPSYHKFIEAVELVKSGGGFSVASYDEFSTVLSRLISDENTLLSAGKGCRKYIENNRGATALIISHLLENDQQ